MVRQFRLSADRSNSRCEFCRKGPFFLERVTWWGPRRATSELKHSVQSRMSWIGAQHDCCLGLGQQLWAALMPHASGRSSCISTKWSSSTVQLRGNVILLATHMCYIHTRVLWPLHARGLRSRVLAHASTHTSANAYTMREGQEPPFAVFVQVTIYIPSRPACNQEHTRTRNTADSKTLIMYELSNALDGGKGKD